MASGSSEWPQECSLCDVKLASKAVASSHYSGSKHAKNVREKQQLKKDAKKPLGIFTELFVFFVYFVLIILYGWQIMLLSSESSKL